MNLRAGVLLALSLALMVFLVHVSQPEEGSHKRFVLLDEHLKVIGYSDTLPRLLEGRVLIGKTNRGYVYVPLENTYTPLFVDRFLYIGGKKAGAENVLEWWMETNGVRIDPLSNLAYKGFTLYVKTPFEIVKSVEPVIALYQPVYLGKEFDLNDECVAVKEWGKTLVPVLLPGSSGVVDPDTRVECRKCKGKVTIRVVDENGVPLSGFFSEGDGTRYTFFGEFNGEFEVCACSHVKIYVDGFRPVASTFCTDTNVALNPLSSPEKLDGNYVVLDSTGALVTWTAAGDFPPGDYRIFNRFPLFERSKGLPLVELNTQVWYGYKSTRVVPVYALVRKDDKYFYVLREGLIELNGLLCREGMCTVTGEIPLVAFGKCVNEWEGVLVSKCPALGVKPFIVRVS